MPKKPGGQIQKYNEEKSVYRVLASTPRLLEDGEAHPDFLWRNKADLGFASPFREYVESPVKPSMLDLSTKWNVPYTMIESWKMRQRWEEVRARQWQSIQGRAWELSREAIAQVQSRELQDQLANWRQQRDALAEALRHGKIVTQSATGRVSEITLSLKDRKDAAQTMALCDENINRIMGMGRGLIAAGEAIDDPKTARPVRRVRHNYTITEEISTEELPPANPLPEIDLPLLEGEIIPNE